jgi:hypothetical protein
LWIVSHLTYFALLKKESPKKTPRNSLSCWRLCDSWTTFNAVLCLSPTFPSDLTH